MSQTTLSGTCEPEFERVRDLMAAHLTSGREIGASLYLNIDGEEVIDLWGGWRDEERTAPWDENTVVNVFSATKTVTSVALLILVDREMLELDAPVARYWPEFAANGKAEVKVRHLLSHTSGVPAWEQPFRFEDAFDVATSTARLAAQSPWWEPGTRGTYHASTFGHLNGELLRRVTNTSLSNFIATELAGPLEAPFFLGVPESESGRIATIYPATDELRAASPSPTENLTVEDVISAKTHAGSLNKTMGDPFLTFNSPRWRRAEFGGSCGHANAKGLGRILSAVALGGTSRGRTVLSPETIDEIFRVQASGTDLYYRKPITWGVGYALSSADSNSRGPLPFLLPGTRTCFWYGTGGSFGIVDAERRMTLAYAMNKCRNGRNSLNGTYYQSIYDAAL